MYMKFVVLALCVCVWAKWFLIIALFPSQVARVTCYKKHSTFAYIFSIPIRLVEKILRGGYARYAIYQISTLPSRHLRKWFYMGLGANIGRHVVFHFKTEIRSPHKLKIGNGTIVGDNALFDASSGLTIGQNVNISSNVSIYTLQHNHRKPDFSCDFEDRNLSVNIGDRVWLGSNVIVLPGVNIGEGAVCCAGCVVTKDIAPFDVVAGIPAKKVGSRPNNMTYQFNGKSCRIY